MSTSSKNPLHASTITVNDLNVGRRVIVFHKHLGILHESTVVTRPYILRVKPRHIDRVANLLVVDLLDSKQGITEPHYLNEMGVIPFTGGGTRHPGWGYTTFTIDARKRELLPVIGPSFVGDFLAKLDDARRGQLTRTAFNG